MTKVKKRNKTKEIKQNQAFFHKKYSNLTSFFIGNKILKDFNKFHDCHLSIPLHN